MHSLLIIVRVIVKIWAKLEEIHELLEKNRRHHVKVYKTEL